MRASRFEGVTVRGSIGTMLASALLAVSAHATPIAAYTLMGENATVVRVVTAADRCPALSVDGRVVPLAERMPPATLALRPTAMGPARSKPSVFPYRTCEAALAPGARHASVEGMPLSLARRVVTRIVVIGDTGCRIKGKVAQACDDAAAFPFAAIAARAAAWHPQLVVHVGDYLYRETACPSDASGCARSPWGYGWDAWAADFFTPAAPLLAAAPWVVVRGNHESCARGGQGWWRLLDPRPLAPRRDCNDAADDAVGDAGSAYPVPLGRGGQVVVADLAAVGDEATPADDPRFADTTRVWHDIAAQSTRASFTFMAAHKPVLGFKSVKGNRADIRTATEGLTSVFGTLDPLLLPAGIDVVLSGHEHVWQQVGYGGRLPSQFITGFSGTQEDSVPLPVALPPSATTAGVRPDTFSSWSDGFGYMTLERRGRGRWAATVWDVHGAVVNRCRIDGRRSSCAHAQVAAQPVVAAR